MLKTKRYRYWLILAGEYIKKERPITCRSNIDLNNLEPGELCIQHLIANLYQKAVLKYSILMQENEFKIEFKKVQLFASN